MCLKTVPGPVSEFNELKPRFKSPKNRFQLSAGLNLKKLNTILSETKSYLSRGLNLNCGSNSLKSASGYICKNEFYKLRIPAKPKTFHSFLNTTIDSRLHLFYSWISFRGPQDFYRKTHPYIFIEESDNFGISIAHLGVVDPNSKKMVFSWQALISMLVGRKEPVWSSIKPLFVKGLNGFPAIWATLYSIEHLSVYLAFINS